MVDLPAGVKYGRVHGRFILAILDSSDPNELPDARNARGTITFQALVPFITDAGSDSIIAPGPFVVPLDSDGAINEVLVAVDAGLAYRVTFNVTGFALAPINIVLFPDDDIDLLDFIPAGVDPGTVVGPGISAQDILDLLDMLANFHAEAYVQPDEPTGVPIGTLWFDTDETV